MALALGHATNLARITSELLWDGPLLGADRLVVIDEFPLPHTDSNGCSEGRQLQCLAIFEAQNSEGGEWPCVIHSASQVQAAAFIGCCQAGTRTYLLVLVEGRA